MNAMTTPRLRLVVVRAEPHPNYNRVMLSPVLAREKTFDEIVKRPRQVRSERHRVDHRRARLARRPRHSDGCGGNPGGCMDGAAADLARASEVGVGLNGNGRSRKSLGGPMAAKQPTGMAPTRAKVTKRAEAKQDAARKQPGLKLPLQGGKRAAAKVDVQPAEAQPIARTR